MGEDIDFRISNETQIGFVRDEAMWYPLQVVFTCVDRLNELREIKGVQLPEATYNNQIVPQWLKFPECLKKGGE